MNEKMYETLNKEKETREIREKVSEELNEKLTYNLTCNLTQKEQEIMIFLCEGLTNKEIAEKLFISKETVKWHVSSIIKKMNVKNRMQVVVNELKKRHAG